ncbi:MAG: type II toxin-antitoxin system YafQ family toxin [Phascolarctobacterium sp.]|nr:type II toxin-antitoxin system YafQ family toxin [Phascolarctobacterium sp.]
MKLRVVTTVKFNRDLRNLLKCGFKDIRKLDKVVEMIANGEKLSYRYKDHLLKGNYAGFRECHIEPDWLLIYKIER